MTRVIYLDEPSYLPKSAIEALESIAEFEVFRDKPSLDQTIERLREADSAIVEWTALPSEVFVNPGKLRHVALVTTGYSKVDLSAARTAGVDISNTPEYSRQSVAEHAFGLILSAAKRIPEADTRVQSDPKAKYTDHEVGVQLYGKTLGILGLGSIGTWIAKIGQGFGMDVISYTRSQVRMPGVTQLPLDDVLAKADVIAISLPNSADVVGLLSSQKLGLMRHGSILINVSGNGCLDQSALARMLETGHIYGAGLDSGVSPELAGAPHLIRTGGTAWYTQSALDLNLEMVVETIRLGLQGEPRFVVN
jgi:glycerate dehydrogenase